MFLVFLVAVILFIVSQYAVEEYLGCVLQGAQKSKDTLSLSGSIVFIEL